MKKKKLSPVTGLHKDFTIFDIVTSLPDFKLAYHLNKNLDLCLEKEKDLSVFSSDKKPPEIFSFYYFKNDNTRYIYLISKLMQENPLMANYFLLYQGFLGEEEQEDTLDKINGIPEIFHVDIIDLTTKTNKKNTFAKKIILINTILIDLEYHIMTIKKKM